MWFRKKLVWAAARPSELSIAEQDCGTWYGCRWKPHQPTVHVIEGMWANRNRCETCGAVIKYEDGDPDGQYGEWILDEYVIHEEEEI